MSEHRFQGIAGRDDARLRGRVLSSATTAHREKRIKNHWPYPSRLSPTSSTSLSHALAQREAFAPRGEDRLLPWANCAVWDGVNGLGAGRWSRLVGGVQPGDVLAVSVEPAGGSAQPTTKPLVTLPA